MGHKHQKGRGKKCNKLVVHRCICNKDVEARVDAENDKHAQAVRVGIKTKREVCVKCPDPRYLMRSELDFQN